MGLHVCFIPLSLIRQPTSPPAHQHCTRNFSKIHHDDGSNKGCREVIARIPTPIAGLPHYTAASEVATMDFLRVVLKLPMPKYILMEQFRHGEREKMESGRGPWLSPVDCVTSPARREMAVIQHHAKAQPRQTFLLPTNYDIHPSEHSSLLSQFIHTLAPTLRHPDLSLEFVSIIDWQDAVIYPRFMQAGYPAFCEHDSSRPQSLQIPSLPDHFDEMSVDEQRQSRAVFRLEEANLYYTAATGVNNKQHLDVLKLRYLGMLQYLLRQTGYPWDADVINLRAALVEREAAIAESQEWNESEQLLSRVREHLNIDLEGGTDPDNFERAVEGNRQFRMEMVRQAEADQQEICWRNWPYKDKEDSSMPPQEVNSAL
ncbi:hypothetical protein BJX68DRAFT_260014 [Aspergillus pseudodeflectus]|uniref:Aminoglycoside phosphotransferase domain-containing protein n=1 Tax=Aspergillus pseudodeflectus TaxID=176178 RepID=A0ABR4J7V4_9EURO